MEPLELWAGVEATVNRVGHRLFDQMARSGHASRLKDLDLIAETGIKAIRYPCLWEHVQGDGPDSWDWSFSDERLARLRHLGIRPIAGLLHHGSGPRWTSLVDPRFPRAFARYARAFAERYPWITDYTPVNEPLTTARFSGLYGHWYPHGRDERVFVRALWNELEATRLSMREIRAVNPEARLIQTEDRALVTSTQRVAYEAEFQNHRSWLTWDVLCGLVTTDHPLHDHVRTHGVSSAEVAWFLEDPCPPDVLGMNYYITSDRFLDEHVELHPPEFRGGNGRDAFADTHTQRIGVLYGHQAHLEDTWARYGRPIAITEVQLDAGREEQLRWLHEAWSSALRARALGVDVRAVTVWALFGSFDWDTLVTRVAGHYEVGAFDVRAPGGEPRPTAVARAMRTITTDGAFDHPVLALPGMWRRHHTPMGLPPPPFVRTRPRPILVVGAGGTLGRAFMASATYRGLPCRAATRADVDINDPASVEAVLRATGAWAVVNAAGYVRVDDAEDDADACRRANVDAARVLAEACAERQLPFVTFSSDFVFDGARGPSTPPTPSTPSTPPALPRPYVESDAPAPLSVYGVTKAEAEARVLEAWRYALVVRTSAFIHPASETDFLARALRDVSAGVRFAAAADVVVSPTYVPALVDNVLDLLMDEESGILHLACAGAVSWAELARRGVALAGLDPDLVDAVPALALGWRARRPRYSVLGSERVALMPGLAEALALWSRSISRSIDTSMDMETSRRAA